MSQTIDLTSDIHEPVQPTIMNLIEQASRRYPGHPAIKQGGQQRSYSALTSSIEQLAHQLINEGVTPGDVIAIHGGKSIATITAMLSVLWAGGVMLPLDEDLPLARKAIMLREAAAKYVLLTGS